MIRTTCVFLIIIASNLLSACSSEDERITYAVPEGYAPPAKIQTKSWEETALAALAFSEAVAAEPPAEVKKEADKVIAKATSKKPSWVVGTYHKNRQVKRASVSLKKKHQRKVAGKKRRT